MQHDPISATEALPAFAEFSCEPAAIEAAATFLARRIVEARNTIPIVSCVLIVADIGGTVTLKGTDLDISASITIAAAVDQPGAFCTDAKALADVLGKARKDKACREIVITDDGARVAVKAARGRYRLGRMPRDDFPVLNNREPHSLFNVPVAQFVADLAGLSPCISAEESRYYLNGVAWQRRELAGRERLVMAATDGHAMGIASRPIPAGAEALPDIIVPRKAVAVISAAAKLATDCEDVAITVGSGITATLANITITTKLIDATYPDWERPFAGHLAPIDGEPALFPDLLPGAPAAMLEKVAKPFRGAMQWSRTRDGLIGSVAGDDGFVFGVMAMASVREPRKGFHVPMQGGVGADYLVALAASRGEVTPAAMSERAVAINAEYGQPSNAHYNGEAPWGRADFHGAQLIERRGRVVGLTIAGEHKRYRWSETVFDYEAMIAREFEHAEMVEPIEGSYSILMPADAPQAEPASYVEGTDGNIYPIADNGTAIHLSAAQLRALIGESCFETMAVPIPPAHPLYRKFRGEPAYVARWLYDEGDSRLLIVKKDGRCFDPAKYARDYLMRDEIDALIAGEWRPEGEPVEIPAPASLAAPQSETEQARPMTAESEIDAVRASEPGAMQDSQIATDVVTDDNRLSDMAARMGALERQVAALSRALTPTARPARTAAHERAIRRAWAERKARRERADLDSRALFKVNADNRVLLEQLQAAEASREQIAEAFKSRTRHLQAQLDAKHANMEKWADEARKGRRGRSRRLAATRRARRMLSASRTTATFQRQRADVLHAQLVALKAAMADPSQPERASDVHRLIQERDQARTACTALEQRVANMQTALTETASAIEEWSSRAIRAEAAMRAKAA